MAIADSAREFRAALAALSLSQQAFARYAGVNARTVQRWALGEQSVPPIVMVILSLLRTRTVGAPPHGSHPSHDRTANAVTALTPHCDNLVRMGRSVGWAEPEIAAAMIAWAIQRVGIKATREMVEMQAAGGA